jgi:hypothetical protein
MDRCYLEASEICPNLLSTVFCIEPKKKKKKKEREEEEEADGFCIMEAEEEDCCCCCIKYADAHVMYVLLKN